MSLTLPATTDLKSLDRERVDEQVTTAYQERANKAGLQLEYYPYCRKAVVYRNAAPLCSFETAGELRMFLLGYENARELMRKEILGIVARLEANGIEPMGHEGGSKL